ncbi:cytochrome bd oxidase small subunit CydS [Rummeliibacillus pycnus]
MEKILIFYGPFIVVIISIIIGFYVASKDQSVTKDEK